MSDATTLSRAHLYKAYAMVIFHNHHKTQRGSLSDVLFPPSSHVAIGNRGPGITPHIILHLNVATEQPTPNSQTTKLLFPYVLLVVLLYTAQNNTIDSMLTLT